MRPAVRQRPAANALVHDDGQVTPLFAVLAVALLVLGGLVFDGGQILTARRQADDLARQAARAGAQALDETSLRSGTPRLDPVAADAATRDFLAARDLVPDHVTVTDRQVAVTITLTQPTPLLALVGIPERAVTATASAVTVRGIEEAEP